MSQNPITARNECVFKPQQRKTKKIVRLTANAIDSVVREDIKYSLGFNIITNDDGTYYLDKYDGRSEFVIYSMKTTDVKASDEQLILSVRPNNIQLNYDLILDESLTYSRYMVKIECCSGVIDVPFPDIYADCVDEMTQYDTESFLKARRIRKLNSFASSYASLPNILCGSITVNPLSCQRRDDHIFIRNALHERFRTHEKQESQFTLIGAFFLIHRARCTLKDNQKQE